MNLLFLIKTHGFIVSFDITQSKEYKAIYAIDPKNTRQLSEKGLTQDVVSQAAQGVIKHLQSAGEVDTALITQFISHIHEMDAIFAKEGSGHPFTTSLVALKALLTIRQTCSEDRISVLLKDHLVTQLAELSVASATGDKVVIAAATDYCNTKLRLNNFP